MTTGRPADFQATPEYLAQAIDDAETVPHRFEGSIVFDLGGRSIGGDSPMMTGEFDGERTAMQMDLGAMFQSMADEFGEGAEIPTELFGDDLTMEMVSDTTALYLRAPFFSSLAEQMEESGDAEDLGAGGEPFDVFSELGDDWAKIDLTAVEDAAPGELGGLGGANQNMDPRAYLELLAGADAVEELGSDEIDGEPVTGLAATVNFMDMLEAQGANPDDMLPADENFTDVMEDFEFDVELWMDGDANIRRFTIDMSQMIESIAEESDEGFPTGGFNFSMTFDFFDYGDESIEVEVPQDAVDLTEEFVEQMETLPGD